MASSGDPASVSWLDALWLSPPGGFVQLGEIAKHALAAPCLAASLRY